MSYLLHIDASTLGEASFSRQVARSFRDEWQGAVVHRDLAVSPAPHLSAAGITARTTDPAEHTCGSWGRTLGAPSVDGPLASTPTWLWRVRRA
ncbi:hypothetical protein [Streptomyces sp. MAI_2237]